MFKSTAKNGPFKLWKRSISFGNCPRSELVVPTSLELPGRSVRHQWPDAFKAKCRRTRVRPVVHVAVAPAAVPQRWRSRQWHSAPLLRRRLAWPHARRAARLAREVHTRPRRVLAVQPFQMRASYVLYCVRTGTFILQLWAILLTIEVRSRFCVICTLV